LSVIETFPLFVSDVNVAQVPDRHARLVKITIPNDEWNVAAKTNDFFVVL
jgi:hypothetical protein